MSEYEFEEEEFNTQFNGRTVLRILAQAKPHWPWVVGFAIAVGIVAGLDAVFTFLGKQIIDVAILGEDIDALISIGTRYFALIVVQAIAVFAFIILAGFLGERIQYDLRRKSFNHLQTLSFSYFDRTPVGWIISRVTSDTTRIAELVTWGMLDITWAVVGITTSLFFMLIINWRLALLVFTVIPVLIVVAAEFKKRILVQFRQVRKLNSKITGAYNENITGVRVSKAFGREDTNLFEFTDLTGEMYNASYRAALLSALFLPIVQVISAIAIGIIVWYGGYAASIGGMTIGGIHAFVSYVIFMLWPIQEVARVYAEMQQSIASAERVFSLVDSQPEVVDTPESFDPGTIVGDIEFKHVDYWYEPEKPVYEDFNLNIKRGETIALVGPTGGGKSTLVNLIARFYEPTGGEIRIGDHDYRAYTQEAIQARLGMVLQTPHLFSGTIRENIRYGRLDATDEEIEEVAKIAAAHEFIVDMPKGYEEDVGEGGNLLSVGQKQLISLARAVLSKPEIVIMDEATSSVDTVTEELIQKGMEALMEGRTSLVIAHRLSTIKNADRILVIEGGKITEQGSHAELIRAQGHYYNLYTRQFRNKREADYKPLILNPQGTD